MTTLALANPLAYEVSRAFVPPCTWRDVSPGQWQLSDQTLSPEP